MGIGRMVSMWITAMALMLSGSMAQGQAVTQCVEGSRMGDYVPLAEITDRLSRNLLMMRVYSWIVADHPIVCDTRVPCRAVAERYFWVIPRRLCEICSSCNGCVMEVFDEAPPADCPRHWERAKMIWLMVDPVRCTCAVLGIKPLLTPWMHTRNL